MDYLASKYNRLFYELADPRVADWPLMSGPLPLAVLLCAYLGWVMWWGPRWMSARPALELRGTLRAYNVAQVLACLVLIWGTATNGWTDGRLSPFRCEPPVYDPEDKTAARLAAWCWWTFALKVAELIETVFFVLRKKHAQVSALHLYHHVSTVLVCWMGVKYVAGGMATFSIMINSFVHVVMYTYYLAATSRSARVRRLLAPLKPKITLLQMAQFCVILAHSSIALRADCPVPRAVAYVFIPNVLLIFYMFYGFFTSSYRRRASKQH